MANTPPLKPLPCQAFSAFFYDRRRINKKVFTLLKIPAGAKAGKISTTLF